MLKLKLNSKHFAFTLAEVLITLSIIGIIAAITLPSVISSYKKRVVLTKLQKFNYVMNNAIKLSYIENGNFLKNMEVVEPSEDNPTGFSSQEQVIRFIEKYILKYMKYDKIAKVDSTSDFKSLIRVDLLDGSMFFINAIPQSNFIHIWYLTDNRYKEYWADENLRDEVLGKYSFIFYTDANHIDKGQGMVPYDSLWDGTREDLFNNSLYGCAKSAEINQPGVFCTKLIQYDGWKISKDYPVKF